MDDNTVMYDDSNDGGMGAWSPMAQFKAKTVIANAWADMPDDRRNELCDQGMATGNIGAKWRREGKAIVFTWAGADIAVVEEAWLVDDSITYFPQAQILPDCPDDISGLEG